MEPSPTPLVELREISLAFGGVHAVDRASLDLHRGEVVALLGHNGAGKSTLIKKLKADGLGIFLISHDIHDVFDLADRMCVMKNGRVVGTAHVADVSKDDVLGMIILGKCPKAAVPGPGAMQRSAEPIGVANSE